MVSYTHNPIKVCQPDLILADNRSIVPDSIPGYYWSTLTVIFRCLTLRQSPQNRCFASTLFPTVGVDHQISQAIRPRRERQSTTAMRRKSPLCRCNHRNKATDKILLECFDLLSCSLVRELGWSPNEGNPEDKVVGVYTRKTVS